MAGLCAACVRVVCFARETTLGCAAPARRRASTAGSVARAALQAGNFNRLRYRYCRRTSGEPLRVAPLICGSAAASSDSPTVRRISR